MVEYNSNSHYFFRILPFSVGRKNGNEEIKHFIYHEPLNIILFFSYFRIDSHLCKL